ncbi:MAG: lactate utilization protein [bacterium]|jgi:L-lactate utilization protein LutB
MEERDWYWLTRMKKAAKALERNGIRAYVTADRRAALKKALSLIKKGSTVGLGGSRTADEIGLLEALRSGEYGLFDQYGGKHTKAERMQLRKQGTHADCFVCGSNAITEDGKLVNIDGVGNRLAGMCYGPGKVIIVAGRNKIVGDVDEAIDRVKNVAAPMNARRLGQDTPCARTGRCADCSSPDRICSLTLVIEKQKSKDRMHVILINEELGF